MPATHSRMVSRVFIAMLMCGVVASSATAQLSDILSGGPLGSPDSLQGGVQSASPETVVTLFAQFTAPVDGRPGLLSVTAAH